MLFKYKKEDFTIETVSVLIDNLNIYYKKRFDDCESDAKKYERLILSQFNFEYDDIFTDYISQIFEIIYFYSDFNLLNSNGKDTVHNIRENHINKMKQYKENSFDNLFKHFGDNFSVY